MSPTSPAGILRWFHPVLPAASLRARPVPFRLGGTRYVLWRDATGAARGLLDWCAHRFAPLSAGRVRPDGRLACPYHGWNYDGAGPGEQAAEVEFEHENLEDSLRVQYRGPQRPNPWLPLLGVKPGDVFQNDWVTRYDPVWTCYTLRWFEARTWRPRPLATRFSIFMVPEDDRTTTFHTFLHVHIGLARGAGGRSVRPLGQRFRLRRPDEPWAAAPARLARPRVRAARSPGNGLSR